MTDAPGAGKLLRVVAIPSLAAGVVAIFLGAFLGAFVVDVGPLHVSLAAAWAFYAAGRGLLHWDVPKHAGAALQRVATGGALGLAGMGLLLALFEDGPGWPYTPLWALALGFASGVSRSHKPLLARARGREAQGRLWGVFDRRELAALGILLFGYAMAGLALWRLFLAFSGVIPEAGKALTIGIALYALHGARLLLAFASHESGSQGAGFLGWFKANLLRNAIVVLLLVAYAVYRGDLSRSLPFFPFLEFALGMAVFTFLLARLRSRISREATDRATASDAQAHRQKVQTLAEPEYDAVAGPVSRFIETGRGQREYVETLRALAMLPPAQADPLLAPVAAHREPYPQPVLPLGPAVASALLSWGLGGVALLFLFLNVFDAPWKAGLVAALVLFGVGAYVTQGEARKRLRPWDAVGMAALGVVLVAGTIVYAVLETSGGMPIPAAFWWTTTSVSALALGVPAYLSWRLDKALREGTYVAPPREPPALELVKQLRAARQRAVVGAATLLGLLLLVPPVARWVAERGWGFEGFPQFYSDLMTAAFWVFAALVGGSLVRFWALRRARSGVLAEERRRRDARLSLHKTLMQHLERV